jgi:hypothetical protein
LVWKTCGWLAQFPCHPWLFRGSVTLCLVTMSRIHSLGQKRAMSRFEMGWPDAVV